MSVSFRPEKLTPIAILLTVGPRFEDMNRLFEAKKIKPVIDKVFSFDEVPQAYAYVQAQQHIGKVVKKGIRRSVKYGKLRRTLITKCCDLEL